MLGSQPGLTPALCQRARKAQRYVPTNCWRNGDNMAIVNSNVNGYNAGVRLAVGI